MSVYLTIFGKPRYLGIMEVDSPVLVPGEPVAIETMRGIETATVGGPISEEQTELYRKANENSPKDGAQGGEPGLQTVTFVAQASEDDIVADQENRRDEEDVLFKARQLLGEHGLAMKIVDVEYLLDRKKLFFYFTAEQRIDFRAYVRDLAREFRTRIELRQIGVRDEAKVVRGIAPCGNPCCCSYWLHNFLPIGIKMVKEQNLALNPTKISGLCGRLMCCMSYEHHVYRELWKKLPNPGSKIRSPRGTFILVGVDIDGENALVRTPDGAHVSISVEKFADFKGAVMAGEDWQPFVVVSDQETEKPPIEPIFAMPISTKPVRKDKDEPSKKEEHSGSSEKSSRKGAPWKDSSSDKPKSSSRRRRRKKKKPAATSGEKTTDKSQGQKPPKDKVKQGTPKAKSGGKEQGPPEKGDSKPKPKRRRRRKKPGNNKNADKNVKKDGNNVSKGGTVD
ncbi:MAG: regulatory iron-sulfur-containing complex subunit RicT [Synergistota bacterium]|nr:regulatory iron-sulfur-containing complex subunit RicT [Synergistota bacterium]